MLEVVKSSLPARLPLRSFSLIQPDPFGLVKVELSEKHSVLGLLGCLQKIFNRTNNTRVFYNLYSLDNRVTPVLVSRPAASKTCKFLINIYFKALL